MQEDINTRKGVERIIRYAFDYARQKQMAASGPACRDKSNVMTLRRRPLAASVQGSGAASIPDIQRNTCTSTRCACRWCAIRATFDVIVTNNMFGDIVTDLAAALQGGLGMAASGNIHPGRTSMFEPVHGSAPPMRGKKSCQPDGRDSDGGHDAGSPGAEWRSRENRGRGTRGGSTEKDYAGYWWNSRDARSRRLDRCPRQVASPNGAPGSRPFFGVNLGSAGASESIVRELLSSVRYLCDYAKAAPGKAAPSGQPCLQHVSFSFNTSPR